MWPFWSTLASKQTTWLIKIDIERSKPSKFNYWRNIIAYFESSIFSLQEDVQVRQVSSSFSLVLGVFCNHTNTALKYSEATHCYLSTCDTYSMKEWILVKINIWKKVTKRREGERVIYYNFFIIMKRSVAIWEDLKRYKKKYDSKAFGCSQSQEVW